MYPGTETAIGAQQAAQFATGHDETATTQREETQFDPQLGDKTRSAESWP